MGYGADDCGGEFSETPDSVAIDVLRMPGMTPKKKLIEVALPLDAINAASAREKSIRHGHPSTLHLWWARRPLAAARAVIFAQMVDDPSAHPDLFPTEKKQEKERQRLFRIIEDLVKWENTTNEEVLERARAEIWQSWRRTCAENADHPRAKELFDRHKLPAFHDPFAGGGALPLEAQRLGLESYASDLNPVAVLINKAMIEIPPRFAGRPPVNPESRNDPSLLTEKWRGAQGLAADIRYYGKWMRDEAEKRIGHLYPTIEITDAIVADQPNLKPHKGQKLTVIAWLWARTVASPDPAMGGVHVPLVSSYWLCKKPGKLAWLLPVIDRAARRWRFEVRTGKPIDEEAVDAGTKVGRGDFRCLLSDSPIAVEYVREQGKAGAIRYQLLAVVADAGRGRAYVSAPTSHEGAANVPLPTEVPTTDLPKQALGFRVQNYGYSTHARLFTPRQLSTLETLTSLVSDARAKVLNDAQAAGFSEGPSLEQGGMEAAAYADAVAVLLGMAVSRRHDRWTAFSIWHTVRETLESLIRLSAVPMTWEFAEGNPFSEATGNFRDGVDLTANAVEPLGVGVPGSAEQKDARLTDAGFAAVISTDPPYFDNIPYADLSDLFYVWLRRSLRPILPNLMATVLVPKAGELVADAARHGGRDEAQRFFFDGMRQAFAKLRDRTLADIPIAIFYAFRQSESGEGGVVSTGWESFLSAVIDEGFEITGTWPIRTEQSGGLRNVGRNSLATSVVLICRPRTANAGATSRREFAAALRAELPLALRHLQSSNIAPVDLAQAAIGPGMAVFTGYTRVLDAEGQSMTVGQALALINQTVDEVLVEQEGDFDVDSRWALAWFDQYGFDEGPYGVAETLSKAKNTSIEGMEEAGILESGRGKVRLLPPSELPIAWDPEDDRRINEWEMLHHLIRVFEHSGEAAAAQLLTKYGSKADVVRELAYRLYTACERKKRAKEAGSYNALVQSWPEIVRLSKEQAAPATPRQGAGFFDEE
jgi:putative DNA methylase